MFLYSFVGQKIFRLIYSVGCIWQAKARFTRGFFFFREIKLDVTWSYVKRQTAKMKLLPSVFSSLNSRVKIFVFVANSRRHFSIFI